MRLFCFCFFHNHTDKNSRCQMKQGFKQTRQLTFPKKNRFSLKSCQPRCQQKESVLKQFFNIARHFSPGGHTLSVAAMHERVLSELRVKMLMLLLLAIIRFCTAVECFNKWLHSGRKAANKTAFGEAAAAVFVATAALCCCERGRPINYS